MQAHGEIKTEWKNPRHYPAKVPQTQGNRLWIIHTGYNQHLHQQLPLCAFFLPSSQTSRKLQGFLVLGLSAQMLESKCDPDTGADKKAALNS